MTDISPTQKEDYAKVQKADIMFRVITNKPKSPYKRVNSKDDLEDKNKNPLIKLSIEDYEIICINKDYKRIVAELLDTSIKSITDFCRKTESFKKILDLAPITLREKTKAQRTPIKDLSPELLSSMSAKASSLLSVLPDLVGNEFIENHMINLSSEDCEIICINNVFKRIIAKLLDTHITSLTNLCKKNERFRKKLDLSPNTIREKTKILRTPIKDLSPELLSVMNEKTSLLLTDLDDDLLKRITSKIIPLLKYKLREYIPPIRIELRAFSLNPNALDFLSLQKNKKYINYSELSKNTNIKAIELLKAEAEVNPENIDWDALSKNPEAIDILNVNRGRIKLARLSANTNPRAIQLLIQHKLERVDMEDYDRDDDISWDALSENTSTEAIEFLKLPQNYGKINWEELSGNTNPMAIELLTSKYDEELALSDDLFRKLKPKKRLNWHNLSKNPEAISLLERKWADEKMYNLKKYKQLKKIGYIIHWSVVSANPKAIELLRRKIEEENKLSDAKYESLEVIEKIHWWVLSANQEAIQLLEENRGKINWVQLGKNPKAIKLLEEELIVKPENIIWYSVSQNPEAIHILDKNKDKIVWSLFSKNPKAGEAGELLKDRIEFEKLPKKEYDKISTYNKLNWFDLSANPSIFMLA